MKVDSEDYFPLTLGDGSVAVGSVAVGSVVSVMPLPRPVWVGG